MPELVHRVPLRLRSTRSSLNKRPWSPASAGLPRARASESVQRLHSSGANGVCTWTVLKNVAKSSRIAARSGAAGLASWKAPRACAAARSGFGGERAQRLHGGERSSARSRHELNRPRADSDQRPGGDAVALGRRSQALACRVYAIPSRRPILGRAPDISSARSSPYR